MSERSPFPPPPDWQPAPHPEPPTDLTNWDLPLAEVRPPWFQCHSTKRGPLNFNPRSSGRFNAPAGEFGTTYVSTSSAGAFAEKFLQSARQEGRGVNVVTQATLAAHRLCPITQPAGGRPLRLVDLTGNGPAQIGADGRLSAMTNDPGLTQRWALALWCHPQQPDGLYYRARHDLSRFSIAIFDCAAGLLVADAATDLLAVPAIIADLLQRYHFGVF